VPFHPDAIEVVALGATTLAGLKLIIMLCREENEAEVWALLIIGEFPCRHVGRPPALTHLCVSARRTFRKAPQWVSPPPTAPLPALPHLDVASPVDAYSSSFAPARSIYKRDPANHTPHQRTPLTTKRRFDSTENNCVCDGTPSTPMRLILDFASKVVIAMGTPDSSPVDNRACFETVYTIDEEMKEN